MSLSRTAIASTAIVACCAVPLILLLQDREGERSGARTPEPNPDRSVVQGEGLTLPDDRSGGAQELRAPSGGETARDFLAMHPFGQEILQQLVEEGVDLDRLPVPTESEADARERFKGKLPLGEENVASKRETFAAWPEQGVLTNDWIRLELGYDAALSPEELENLTSRALEFQMEHEAVVDSYLETLKLSVDAFVAEGRFTVSPYVIPRDNPERRQLRLDNGGAMFSTSARLNSGWCASYQLLRGDFPELAQLQSQVRDSRRSRNDAIRGLL